ncbi:hypothetical protein F4778DRAFT_709373 [Xylariomycetidae sp. FL2044]|nr:hypothetical protein F4778DRAFT_709373 [Xylariomycetidae sp. FL2044]
MGTQTKAKKSAYPTPASRKRKLPASWDDSAEAERPSEHAPKEKKPRRTRARKIKDEDPEAKPNKPSAKKVKDETPETKPKKPRVKKDKDVEKRLKRFRAKAPQSFQVVYERATSQRFYVLSRTSAGTPQCPEEYVELTGSTGNIYTVHIAQLPTCTCPHARNGNQCKHILYVMSRVLRARLEHVYQLALLSSELQEIFRDAPPIEIGDEASGTKKTDKNRKEIEGDCPICFTPFEDSEEIVYCRATCGQNIHQECFEMWAATKNRAGGKDKVTCPMCRTPWQGDDDMVKKIKNTGKVGADGYVNVADQLGISRHRDESTYYGGPRRGQPYYRVWR